MESRSIKLKEDELREKLLQIQHGDVLLQEVAKIPAGAVPVPHGKTVVVAHGEETGHSHVIESDQMSIWVLTRNGVEKLFLQIQAPVTIVHDEHRPLPIPRGIYRVGRIKEYDYFTQMQRRVRD